RPWESWASNAPYLAPLIVLAIVSAVEISRILSLKTRSKVQEWALALQGLYLYYFAVCVLSQNAGQTLLQPRYLAYPIWEMWILAVISILGTRLAPKTLKRLSFTEAALLIVLSVGTALCLMLGSLLLGRAPWLFIPFAIGCAFLMFF